MKSFRDFVRVNGRWTRVDKQRNTKGRCLIIDSWIISQCERHFNNHRESRGSTRCVKTLAIFYWIATTGGANLRFTAKVVWHKHKWRHLLFLFLRETNIYGLLFSPLHPFRRTCGNEMFSLKLPTDMQIRGRGCTAHYKSSMFSFWNETFFRLLHDIQIVWNSIFFFNCSLQFQSSNAFTVLQCFIPTVLTYKDYVTANWRQNCS